MTLEHYVATKRRLMFKNEAGREGGGTKGVYSWWYKWKKRL